MIRRTIAGMKILKMIFKESLCFDVETECLMPMPMREPIRWYNGFRYFGESRGYLHLVIGRKPAWRLIFRIYEMLVDYSDWFIKYRIDLEAEMQSFNLIPSYRNYNTFCLVVRSDDDKGDSVVAVLESGMTLYYNFRDEEMEDYQVVRGISLVNYVLSPTIIDLGFLAVALAALSSQNPGVITIAINAVFGSDPAINPDLLAKAFKLDRKMVKNLQSKF
ncbi:Uncharacterized protein TCM_026067 [Theobroma cacao]|uniref:Cupin type-1 domain-containing protein n=1 Tax=Theobroma cacao TaxID=3641 RepID=A0A061F1J1_THECC|nr:Uncharacterized protein TCM_026067 [Theobroma cacao]